MSLPKTVEAREVRVGDRIWSAATRFSRAGWVAVREVTVSDSRAVVLKTGGWETWKHPREGVAVLREETF